MLSTYGQKYRHSRHAIRIVWLSKLSWKSFNHWLAHSSTCSKDPVSDAGCWAHSLVYALNAWFWRMHIVIWVQWEWECFGQTPASKSLDSIYSCHVHTCGIYNSAVLLVLVYSLQFNIKAFFLLFFTTNTMLVFRKT